jgi:agmatinase
MREQGFRWHTMDEIDTRGLDRLVDDTVSHVRGRAPRVYLTVDVDVLDPAFAPGTGTPEPGGLTTRELRGAVHRIAGELDLCAADVVEVSPPFDPSGITALAAERIAIDVLTGMAARRAGRPLV